MWRQVASTANPTQLAAVILCEACAGTVSRPVPPELAAKVNQEFVQWYRRLLQSGAAGVVMAVNRRVEELRKIVPVAAGLIEAAVAEAA